MVSEGRSGLYPVWSWKSLRMKTAQPLWVICAPAWLALAGKKFSPHLQSELLLVLLVPAASHPPTTHHWRAWLHVLANPFAGTAGCCGAPPPRPPPNALSSPGWTSSNTWATCGGPPLNSLQVFQCLSCFLWYLLINNSGYHKMMGKIESQKPVMSRD